MVGREGVDGDCVNVNVRMCVRDREIISEIQGGWLSK